MRFNLTRTVLGASCAAALVVACSGTVAIGENHANISSDGGDGSQTLGTSKDESGECARYEGTGKESGFTNASTEGAPTCARRCGAVPVTSMNGGTYGVDALPSGSCNGASACVMPAYRQKCSEGEGAGYSKYLCQCDAGQWNCLVASAGASVCPEEDAATKNDGGAKSIAADPPYKSAK